MYKMVNGKRVALTPDEATERAAMDAAHVAERETREAKVTPAERLVQALNEDPSRVDRLLALVDK